MNRITNGFQKETIQKNVDGVCRLCPNNTKLVNLFDPGNVHMRTYVLLATGVEIKETDKVSKMICARCCEIAIKLHKYRENAVANDKLLKEQMGISYTPPVTDQIELLRIVSKLYGMSEKTPEKETKLEIHGIEKRKIIIAKRSIIPKSKPQHSSVRKLLKSYKDIILPEEVFLSDVSPVVSVDRSEVTDWFAEQLRSIKNKLCSVTIKKVYTPFVGTESLKPVTHISTEIKQDAPSESSSSAILPSKAECKPLSLKSRTAFSSEPLYQGVDSAPNKQYKATKSKITDYFIANNDTAIQDSKASMNSVDIKPSDLIEDGLSKRSRTSLKRNRGRPKKWNALHSDSEDSSEIAPPPSKKVTFAAPLSKKVTFAPSTTVVTDKSPKKNAVPELVQQGKALEIYLCRICNTIYDTKKDLLDHEKIHLTCKFCKKRMKNITLLTKHQNETCFINITKNQPTVSLPKVDAIPSILKQYASAFEDRVPCAVNGKEVFEIVKEEEISISDVDVEVADLNNDITLSKLLHGQSLDSPNESIFESVFSREADDNDDVFADEVDNGDVVCLSDTDDDAQNTNYLSVETAPSVDNGKVNPTASGAPKSKGKCLKNVIVEKDLLRALFKKHTGPCEKLESSCQTFNAQPFNVVYTSNNLIVLDSMFAELSIHRIPVQFEANEKIVVKFIDELANDCNEEQFECWSDRILTDIQPHLPPPITSSVEISRQPDSALPLSPSCTTVAKYTSAPVTPFQRSREEPFTVLPPPPSYEQEMLRRIVSEPMGIPNKPIIINGCDANTLRSVVGSSLSNFTCSSNLINLANNANNSFHSAYASDSRNVYSNYPPALLYPSNPMVRNSITPYPEMPLQPAPQPVPSGTITIDEEIQNSDERIVQISNNVTHINKIFLMANNVPL